MEKDYLLSYSGGSVGSGHRDHRLGLSPDAIGDRIESESRFRVLHWRFYRPLSDSYSLSVRSHAADAVLLGSRSDNHKCLSLLPRLEKIT